MTTDYEVYEKLMKLLHDPDIHWEGEVDSSEEFIYKQYLEHRDINISVYTHNGNASNPVVIVNGIALVGLPSEERVSLAVMVSSKVNESMDKSRKEGLTDIVSKIHRALRGG